MPIPPDTSEAPDWVAPILAAPKTFIDGSAILADGGSPLTDAMVAADDLAPGEGFVVRAPFDPTPMRGMLEQMGLATHAAPARDGHWRAVVRRPPGSVDN